MKTLGIIAEYNPFHNGHMGMIAAAKKAGYTHIIAVMSGNFVQRAAPAITDKRIRGEAALRLGVDLLLELPVAYATASAQYFATGGVGILLATGAVDALGFGSEAGETESLGEIATFLDTPEFSGALGSYLDKGVTFALARACAVEELLGESARALISQPNNLLAIEYLSAAQKLGWSPELFTLARIGAQHDSREAKGEFASASYLRKLGTNWGEMKPYLPEVSLELCKAAYNDGGYPANLDRLERGVLSYLRRLTPAELAQLPDISEGIENRFYSSIQKAVSLKGLEEEIKTKRYTMSRVRRLVLSAFLAITKGDVTGSPPYIRVLGFNKKGGEVLSVMKDKAALPFSHSLAQLEALGGRSARFTQLEASSCDQYTLMTDKIAPAGFDYRQPGVFL